MYFLNKSGKNYAIKPLMETSSSELQVLDNLQEITTIGKCSIFDSNLCYQDDCSTLTFEGDIAFQHQELSMIDGLERSYTLYKMGDIGWLWHDAFYKNTFISKSLQLLNLHMGIHYNAVEPDEPKNILSLIKHHSPETEIFDFIINESFGIGGLPESMDDPEKNTLFDAEWGGQSNGVFGYQLIIDEDSHKIDRNTFRNIHTAFCPNLGYMKMVIVKEAEQYPVNFNIGLLDRQVFIDNLVEKNPIILLCPNTFLKSDLEYRLNQALQLKQKVIIVNGTNKDGFGVQATISIDSDTDLDAAFNVERLVLTQTPFIQENILFSDSTI